MVFFDFSVGETPAGRVEIGLHGWSVPDSAENFAKLCSGSHFPGFGYEGSIVTNITRGDSIQAGDFINGDGTGGHSIFGKSFGAENYKLKHRKGVVTMLETRRGQVDSRFLIAMKAKRELDGKYVVVGTVLTGFNVLEGLQEYAGAPPTKTIRIARSGELEIKPFIHNY
eukprot:TRINITY_DN9618_c0_g1_i3.p1 TRINITY_DN9618_c0_g1~~TRINITY_DN9618_c0_g1_i3.p1  ORF type:complete len:169 (+),score=11.72 TRINITY_DN9618_c0_g1_i3:184-690(+)